MSLIEQMSGFSLWYSRLLEALAACENPLYTSELAYMGMTNVWRQPARCTKAKRCAGIQTLLKARWRSSAVSYEELDMMGTDIAEWQNASYRSSGAPGENAQVRACI